MAYKDIQVVEVNDGDKIAYEQDGCRLYLGDDELMINLKKYQTDYDYKIDVVKTKNGNIIFGQEIASADFVMRYVAQILMPAATYAETKSEADENGQSTTTRTKNYINTGDVVLKLWAL